MFNILFIFSLKSVDIVLKITIKGILNNITINVLTENKFPIIAIVEDDNNRKTALTYTYTKDGAYYGDKVEHLADLFFATEKCEGWINLYHDAFNDPHWVGKVYTSEEEAKRNAHNTLTTVKIEWEKYL